jgi:hypothetical protein
VIILSEEMANPEGVLIWDLQSRISRKAVLALLMESRDILRQAPFLPLISTNCTAHIKQVAHDSVMLNLQASGNNRRQA